jgi:formate hydrogenlyase subunit 3/multisubunit Na+/H+ antiporter MnhD subunit
MLLVNAGMLGIVFAADLLSFYIFWEIMSWCAFLLISYNRGAAVDAAMKYIVMSVVGSVFMLVGISSLLAACGTLTLSHLAGRIGSLSSGHATLVLGAFCVAFGVKNAVVPLHTWLPDAHSEAPAPFSAVLSGILIKMGTYGLILAIYVLAGLRVFLSPSHSGPSLRSVLLLLAAVTIAVPSFIAVLQDDAKRLLAWSSVAQVGYIILGLAFGTSLAFVGSMFHVLSHATFKALLFFAVGAVEYRTGTRDLNSLGGLARRMPVAFVAVLIGVCALIGVPLTNGFVSKWLIYKTLILEGSPFLAFIALLGTWGTILYGYKLIHHVFLGQLPEKHRTVKKAPGSMQFVLLALSVVVLVLGVVPGIPLRLINEIGVSMGFEPLRVTLWGIASETGALNTLSILFAVAATVVAAWVIFAAAGKSKRIPQEDNYAYTVDFYNPLYRMIGRYLRDIFDEFYHWLADRVADVGGMVRRVYVGDVGVYVIYILLFLSVLFVSRIWWSP